MMILSWWMSCGVGWTYPPESRTLAHSTFISFIMFGIVVLKHWLFWGTQIATHVAILECHWLVFSSYFLAVCMALFGPLNLFFPGRTVMAAMLICHKSVSAATAAAYLPFRCSLRPWWTWRGDSQRQGWGMMGTKHQGLFWAPRFAWVSARTLMLWDLLFCSNDATEKWILRRWNHIILESL